MEGEVQLTYGPTQTTHTELTQTKSSFQPGSTLDVIVFCIRRLSRNKRTKGFNRGNNKYMMKTKQILS